MPERRLFLAAAAAIALPALARERALPTMTDGPFYPAPDWRRRTGTDWDADLTHVERNGRTLTAAGEHLALALAVVDTDGRAIDRATVEIWQCDAQGSYRHPRVDLEPGRFDAGFQGFGSAASGADGRLALRTIRPVPYPGRAPHIHVKLRHPSFGDWTSQLFVAGDPGNGRDLLWRSLGADDQSRLAMRLEPAPAAEAASGLRWSVRQRIVVPA